MIATGIDVRSEQFSKLFCRLIELHVTIAYGRSSEDIG